MDRCIAGFRHVSPFLFRDEITIAKAPLLTMQMVMPLHIIPTDILKEVAIQKNRRAQKSAGRILALHKLFRDCTHAMLAD